MTTTQTTTIQLGTWTDSRGNTRRYVNNLEDLIGLELVYYKTGNIRFATLAGQSISNSAASCLRGVKAWLDDSDQVHVDHWRSSTADITAEQIATLVRDAYAASQEA